MHCRSDSGPLSGRQEAPETDNTGLWSEEMSRDRACVKLATMHVCQCRGDRAERKRNFFCVPSPTIPGFVAPWCGVVPGTPWLLWPYLTIHSAPGKAGSVERRKESLSCHHAGPHGDCFRVRGSQPQEPLACLESSCLGLGL